MTSQVTNLTVDAAGPDPLTVLSADDALTIGLDDEPLHVEFAAVGMPGRDGVDGLGADDIAAVAAGTLPAGLPVAVDRANGKFIAADAAWKPAAFVAGLLRSDVALGFVGAAATAQVTLEDWSTVTGGALLSPGVPYWLAAGGGLTTVAPVSDCVVLVGKALDTHTLLIDPQPPIQM